ncbi:hypothetical protein [Mycolicibacterium brisbanense]
MTVHHINDRHHPDKPTASIIYVSPEMARRVLAKNTRNRPISEAHVQRLMGEMSSGRWQYNGEAIKWSVDDVLLDGQHRLTALSRMPDDFPAVPFLVVRGLPTSTQDTMDQGRKRSDLSNTAVISWAQEHSIEVEIMKSIVCTDMRRVKARPSVVLAVLLHLNLVDGEAAREFSTRLYTGAGLADGDPILTLRDRLDRLREQKMRVEDRDVIGFFILAWNAWRHGRKLTKFQRPQGGSWTYESFPKAV